MKKGVCIYFNGMMEDECFNGVPYKSVVTVEKGEKRFPCARKRGGKVFCAMYEEPTQKMIDDWNKAIKEDE